MTMARGFESKREERLSRAGQIMERRGIDVLLLVKPQNMAYLVGDGRLCAFAVVSREGRVAIGAPYPDVEDVRALAWVEDVRGFGDEVGMLHLIHEVFEEFSLTKARVGLEHTFLTKSLFAMLTHPHALPTTAELRDATPVLAELRMAKSEEEVGLMYLAAQVAQAGMAAAIEAARPGVTEAEVAGEAEAAMWRAGAEGFYRTYVASGPRTGIAHGVPSYRKIERNDLVLVDLHPIARGYCADLGRVFCAGSPTAEQKAALDVFLRAERAAIHRARAGVTTRELEEAMRAPIDEAGYGGNIFGPAIHGIGLEFEEPPLPSGHAFFHGEEEAPPLPEGTALAIGNCGLYMRGFGIRLEDTIVLTEEGSTTLTTYESALL